MSCFGLSRVILEKNISRKTNSSKKRGFLPTALGCSEPWPGLGELQWAGRAGLAGWMCCRVLDWREGTRGTGSNRAGNQRCIGNSGHNFLHLCSDSCRKYWRSMKMPKKLYGGMVVNNPVISTHGSPIRTYGARLISQSGSCVYFCGLVCGVCGWLPVWWAWPATELVLGQGCWELEAWGAIKIDRFVIITFLRFFLGGAWNAETTTWSIFNLALQKIMLVFQAFQENEMTLWL